MAQTMRTVDHDEIREWADARGGRPAVVEGTHDGLGSGILRIDFGDSDDPLESLGWDEFFRLFDVNGLAFTYQDEAEGGAMSFDYSFVPRSEDGNDVGADGSDFVSDE